MSSVNNTLYPLLSRTLRNYLQQMELLFNSKIASHLLKADMWIEGHNKFYPVQTGEMFKDYQLYLDIWKEINAEEVSKLINNSVRLISIRDNFELSFLPKDKEPLYNDDGTWQRKNRQLGKPTRILKRLINAHFTDREYEEFNNQLKMIVEQRGEFEIVEGEQIRYWYNSETYYDKNKYTLNSCMADKDCQQYLDIYVWHCKMLILTWNDKLIGRALLWQPDDGHIYMDRVYCSFEPDEYKFELYAKANKWRYRESNDASSNKETVGWYIPEDNYQRIQYLNLQIDLRREPEYFPCVDSFKYYNKDQCFIQTEYDCDYYILNEQDGNYYMKNIAICECCDYEEEYDIHNEEFKHMVYSEYDKNYYCLDCSIWSDYLGTYITYHNAIEVYTDRDTVDYIPLKYLLSEDADNFIKIGDKWYHQWHRDVIFDEKIEEWILI